MSLYYEEDRRDVSNIANTKDLRKHEENSDDKEIKSFGKSQNTEYTNNNKEEVIQGTKRNGATRSQEFSKYWGEASLKETINKFVPNATESDVTQKGKIIYSNKDTKL